MVLATGFHRPRDLKSTPGIAVNLGIRNSYFITVRTRYLYQSIKQIIRKLNIHSLTILEN